MAGLRNYAEAIVFTLLFGLLIMLFATQFLGSQNPNSDAIVSNYGMDASIKSMNNSLNGFQTFSDNAQKTLGNSSASPIQYVFLIFEGAFQIPMMFLSAIGGGITSLGTVMYTMIGGGWGGAFQLCLSILLAILVLRLILYIIAAIRTGSSER